MRDSAGELNALDSLDARLFNRDGFAIVDPFLDETATGELIDEVEAMAFDQAATRVRRGDAFARRNLLQLRFVRALVQTPQVRNLVEHLSPGCIPVRAILFDKTGSANWTVPWHQDRSIAVQERTDASGYGPWSVKAGVVHVQPPIDVLHRMVTLRIHLDPCDAANGPLRVIGGTHRQLLSAVEIAQAASEKIATPCLVRAGGVVAMRPLILHASSPAAKPSHRRVIHVEWGPRELPGDTRWAPVEKAILD